MMQKKFFERFFVHAEWYDRREDARACALRMARMLDEMERGHPDLARWYRVFIPSGPGVLLRSSKSGIDELTELFEAGISRRDDGPLGDNSGDRILGSGHSLYCHNDRPEPRYISCNISAGEWRAEDRHEGRSSLTLSFRFRQRGNEDLLTVSALLPALLAIVLAWEPDSVELCEHMFREHLEAREGRRLEGMRGGWINYLSEPLFARITPPAEARIERVPGFGRFLIATDQPFTMTNPAHRRAGEAIHDALAPASDALRRWLATPVTGRRH